MAGAVLGTYKLSRDLWPQKSIYEQLFDGSPVVGLIKKDTNFGEKIRYVAVGYGAPQGLSSTFASAKAYKSPSKAEEFQVQKRSYYGAFSIDGLLWRTYKHTGNKALIVEPMARESKNMLREARNNLGRYIHGDGVGALGRLTAASDPTTTQVTLRTGADIRNFSIGMTIELESTGATGGTVRTGTAEITGVGDESSPTLTFSAALDTTIPAAAASDYVYRAGTYDDAPLQGLDAWLPAHSGSPSAFLSVTRTNHATRLAGNELSATTMGPYQRVFRAARIIADQGFKPDCYFMSTRNWEHLANEQLSAGRLVYSKGTAAPVGSVKLGVEYDAIQVMGPRGPVKVYADPWMPDDVERCGELETLCLASLGDLLHWDDGATPGDPMLEDGADSREVRLVGDMNLICEAPAAWCRVSVTA